MLFVELNIFMCYSVYLIFDFLWTLGSEKIKVSSLNIIDQFFFLFENLHDQTPVVPATRLSAPPPANSHHIVCRNFISKHAQHV
jgi:hypothetical protein